MRIFRQENAQYQVEGMFGKKGESAFKTMEKNINIQAKQFQHECFEIKKRKIQKKT